MPQCLRGICIGGMRIFLRGRKRLPPRERRFLGVVRSGWPEAEAPSSAISAKTNAWPVAKGTVQQATPDLPVT